MEQLKTQVETLIRARFPDADVELEWVADSEKLSGHVVSEEFRGMMQRERQRLLWDVLRAGLSTQEQQTLSVLLTFTPAEVRALAAA